MTEIDYEALGFVADDSYCNPDHTIADCARAVVAALRDQGFVVVRRDLLDLARSSLATHENYSGGAIFRDEMQEIDAALAAPGDGGDQAT